MIIAKRAIFYIREIAFKYSVTPIIPITKIEFIDFIAKK